MENQTAMHSSTTLPICVGTEFDLSEAAMSQLLIQLIKSVAMQRKNSVTAKAIIAAAALLAANISLALPALVPPTEAELASITGGAVSNANAGFTGSGYVQFAAEGSLEWTVTVPRDGFYQLEFRYALDTGNRTLNIRDTGYTFNKPNVAFPATGNFATWGTVAVYGKLNGGVNIIRAESTGSGLPNIDHVLVSNTPPDQNKFLSYPIHSSDAVFRGSAANADAYYAAIDPTLAKATLANWTSLNGFGGAIAPSHAKYVNAGDLGFGRSMYVIKWALDRNGVIAPSTTCSVSKELNCNISSYVQNYPTLKDAVNGTNLIATVAMEYTPRVLANGSFDPNKPKFTKFYVFDKNGVRVNRADLDGRGEKFVPGLCNTCHGGKPKPNNLGASNPGYFDGGDTGAHWIPWDLDTFEYNKAASRSGQEAQFKALNKSILETGPTAASAALVRGWYGGKSMPNLTFDGSYVPTGWISTASDGDKSALYSQVFAYSCRSCHYQREVRNNSGHPIFQGELLESTLTFHAFDDFKKYKNEIEALVYDAGVMPLAKRTYENFWRTSQPEILDNELFNGTAMQNPPVAIQGPYAYDFGPWRKPGRPIPNIAGVHHLFGLKLASSPGTVCYQGPIYDLPDIRGAQLFRLNGASTLFGDTFNWSFADYPNSCSPGAGPTINSPAAAKASFTPDPARTAPYYVKLAISNENTPNTNRIFFGRVWVRNTLPPLNFVNDIYPLFNNNYNSSAGHNLSCVHCHSNGNVVSSADGVFNLMDFGIPAADVAGRQSFAYRMAMTRIDCDNPENSLLLRKPEGHAHYNGTVYGFEYAGNSNDANQRAKILRWIMEGAAFNGNGTLNDLACYPVRKIKLFPGPIFTPIEFP